MSGRLDPLKDGLQKSFDDLAPSFRPLGGVPRRMKGKQNDNRDGVDDVDRFDDKPDSPDAPKPKPKPKPEAPPIDRDRNPDWLNDRLDDPDLEFWRRRMAEGDQFNYQNHHRYPENEVTLTNDKRLDSYDPGDSIVSRKNTQLDGVKPETAKYYIDEILSKYSPGTGIKGRPDTLQGDLVLEVPVQNGDVPQAIIDHANSKNPPVVIRDVFGNEYN